MKKIFFLFLIFCNYGFAESYVCKNDETETIVETSIWERHSKDQFTIRLINDDQKLYLDIYHENQNAIILIAMAPDTPGIVTITLNKNDLTYGGSQTFYPFDKDKNMNLSFGRCDKVSN